MLSKRSNSSKPVKRVRTTNNVDKVKPQKVQSISTTIPVNFDVTMYIDPTIGDTELTNTMTYSFDVISMLNSSDVFAQLSKTFKKCKIRKVHGCIDVLTIPNVLVRYSVAGSSDTFLGEMPLSNTLLNCAMLRTVQLGKYFSEFESLQDVKTYEDIVSIGSNIFQAMIPGTSVHLSPEIQASGMMERSQYLDNGVFSNLKMLKNYNATQYFAPTFFLAAKMVTPTTTDIGERFKQNMEVVDKASITILSTTMKDTVVKLSCQFYIDVIMKDLEASYKNLSNAMIYSYMITRYMGYDDNVHIAHIPLFQLGTTDVYDNTFYKSDANEGPEYRVQIIPYVGNYVPDEDIGYTIAAYMSVYVGNSDVVVRHITVPNDDNIPVIENYTRYFVRIDIRNDILKLNEMTPELRLSGNELIDDYDFLVTNDSSYVNGNLAFMYNRTI